jgi:hypothetical protein
MESMGPQGIDTTGVGAGAGAQSAVMIEGLRTVMTGGLLTTTGLPTSMVTGRLTIVTTRGDGVVVAAESVTVIDVGERSSYEGSGRQRVRDSNK